MTRLVSVEDADELVRGDLHAAGVDLCAAVVDVAGLAVHLARLPLAARHVDDLRHAQSR